MRKWTIEISVPENILAAYDDDEIVEEIKERVANEMPSSTEVDKPDIEDISLYSRWTSS